eukprot:2698876-Prymnesium_polylepis.1
MGVLPVLHADFAFLSDNPGSDAPAKMEFHHRTERAAHECGGSIERYHERWGGVLPPSSLARSPNSSRRSVPATGGKGRGGASVRL